MAFQIDTHTLPRISDWITALSRWQATKPWRGSSPHDPRPLDNSRRKYHTTIHLRPDQSIALRLHRTDVVVYHADGTITLTPYASMSTDAFVNQLTPGGIYAMVNTNPGRLVQTNFGIVRLREATRFENTPGGWRVVTPETLGTIDEPVLDRVAARAALKKHGYPEFRIWKDAYLAHGGGGGAAAPRQGGLLDNLAAGPEGWIGLIGVYSASELRRNIYKAEGCVSWVEHQSVSGADLRRIQRNRKAWRWL